MQASRSAGGGFPMFCAITPRSGCDVTPGCQKGSDARSVNCRGKTNKMAAPRIEQTRMHFRVLDSWRGIAALLVAIFHLNVYSAIYPLDFIRNSYLFVDFFFVLSGFVITHSYEDKLSRGHEFASFAIRRFGRLWPLHAAVLVAFVPMERVKLGMVDFARWRSAEPPF